VVGYVLTGSDAAFTMTSPYWVFVPAYLVFLALPFFAVSWSISVPTCQE